MTEKIHSYAVKTTWTGNLGTGTSGYTAYTRNLEISAEGKPVIPGSSDPAFRGDSTRYNPEDLLVSSLSSCHMLWYLHLCAVAGIIVTGYEDTATGTLTESKESGGRFTEIVLHPRVTITDAAKADLAKSLHEKAHHLCFVANSVNFPVRCEPEIIAK
ncbi:MAG: OsmC family protein [Methylacidiphilales bacterium]|nr:OsmC family protein [Candidatus Methylacidiphilales bacterium]